MGGKQRRVREKTVQGAKGDWGKRRRARSCADSDPKLFARAAPGARLGSCVRGRVIVARVLGPRSIQRDGLVRGDAHTKCGGGGGGGGGGGA
jgi:hypothetical protein